MRPGTIATVMLALVAAQAQAQTQPGGRPRVELQCRSFGMGPLLECTVDLQRRDGTPLDGARVTLGALMPSMPMAHSVKPVRAAPTGRPGQFRGTLELEMLGVWAVEVDVTGALRDKSVHAVQVDDCPGEQRCAAPLAKSAAARRP